MHPTEFPPHFHNGEFRAADKGRKPCFKASGFRSFRVKTSKPLNHKRFRPIFSAQRYSLPPQQRRLFWRRAFCPCEGGRQEIDKRTSFGGPCLEGTLQKPTRVSESSPVAGAVKGVYPYKKIRCWTRTRVAEMRPASHTNALGSLFIACG